MLPPSHARRQFSIHGIVREGEAAAEAKLWEGEAAAEPLP